MLFDILNRWTGKVQFTAEIDCSEDAPRSVQIGLAVRLAYKSDADLRGADLRGADLRGADLRGAEIPFVPKIDTAILESIKANKTAGTNGLKMAAWHGKEGCDETNWCQTTHCRAGYAICIAGAAGFALEAKVGPAAAGALIYAKSRPGKPVPNFYCGDAEAMADIEAGAKEEAAS